MRVISLFAGIGGFDLGFERAGMTTVAQVENNAAATAVLQRHYPDVQRFEDVCHVGRHNLPAADLVCGGFPCQDVSVAGNRAGLAGERSGLWFEFLRIITEMMPNWVVIENVPGLLSSNGGADIKTIMDALESLRYIVDIDILDAQHFGVPQRRRRVFILCQKADHLLQTKTSTSALTIAQCLAEILLSILVEARGQSIIGYDGSELASKFSVDGLKRRMKLFGVASGEHCVMLQQNLDAERARFPRAHALLEYLPGASVTATSLTITDELSPLTSAKTEEASGSWNTASSWKALLDDLSQVMKSSITSTELRQTTEQRIYTYAQAALSISAFITLSNNSCPNYWSAESSALTALEEFTNYARAASSQLFAGLEWILQWNNFLEQAEPLLNTLRNSRNGRAAQVLFEQQGGEGHPEPRQSAGQGTAATVSASPPSRRNGGSDPTAGHFVYGMQRSDEYSDADVASTLASRDYKSATDLVTAPLSASGAGTARTGNARTEADMLVVAEAIDVRNSRSNGGISGTLQSKANGGYSLNYQNPIAFNWYAGSQHGMSLNEDLSPTLQVSDGTPPAVQQAAGVRRLTPLECERLQGFPDGWTEGLSDSARYQRLGNAVAVPVIEWLGRRIMALDTHDAHAAGEAQS